MSGPRRGGDLAGKVGSRARWRLATQWLCGVLCLVSGALVVCFGLLYAVAAGYAGSDGPLVWFIVLSALAYPVVAVVAVIISALRFRRTRRVGWRIYLVPVAYLAAMTALLFQAGAA